MLEARDRLGGRMFTGGDVNVLEFGAQFLQDRDVNAIIVPQK